MTDLKTFSISTVCLHEDVRTGVEVVTVWPQIPSSALKGEIKLHLVSVTFTLALNFALVWTIHCYSKNWPRIWSELGRRQVLWGLPGRVVVLENTAFCLVWETKDSDE